MRAEVSDVRCSLLFLGFLNLALGLLLTQSCQFLRRTHLRLRLALGVLYSSAFAGFHSRYSSLPVFLRCLELALHESEFLVEGALGGSLRGVQLLGQGLHLAHRL